MYRVWKGRRTTLGKGWHSWKHRRNGNPWSVLNWPAVQAGTHADGLPLKLQGSNTVERGCLTHTAWAWVWFWLGDLGQVHWHHLWSPYNPRIQAQGRLNELTHVKQSVRPITWSVVRATCGVIQCILTHRYRRHCIGPSRNVQLCFSESYRRKNDGWVASVVFFFLLLTTQYPRSGKLEKKWLGPWFWSRVESLHLVMECPMDRDRKHTHVCLLLINPQTWMLHTDDLT